MLEPPRTSELLVSSKCLGMLLLTVLHTTHGTQPRIRLFQYLGCQGVRGHFREGLGMGLMLHQQNPSCFV